MASILESKLQPIIQSVFDLWEENKYLSSAVNQIEKELTSVKDKVILRAACPINWHGDIHRAHAR